jgi:hypothetical protein
MTDEAFSDYPARVRQATEHPELVYERLPDAYVEVTSTGSEASPSVPDDVGFAVAHGQPPADCVAVPVYSLGHGPPAVPTGRAFVRFASGVKASSREAQLQDAGFEIIEVLSYAPNAAWVQARSGDVRESLENVAAIERLADVENVEPQFLTESHRR